MSSIEWLRNAMTAVEYARGAAPSHVRQWRFSIKPQANALDPAYRAAHPGWPDGFSGSRRWYKLDMSWIHGTVMQPDLARRHRLTVEEYFRMAEVGLLAPEARGA